MSRDRTRILAVLVLLSVIGVVYVGLTATATGDTYTEFYVAGPGGLASEYPTTLSVDEVGTVIVGLSNHEGQQTTYTVDLRLGDDRVDSRTITLQHEERWEQSVSFRPRSTGTKRLDVLLFEGASSGSASLATKRLYLWVEVQNASVDRAVEPTSVGPSE